MGDLDCCQTLVVASEEMIRENTYLSLNRVLLLAVGLWPYERSNLVRLQLILLYGIMAAFIVFQFTTFAISKCTAQFVIEVLSVATLYLAFMIKYNAFCCNMDTVKHLVGILQHIYDGLRDDREIAIIKKYGNVGRRYTSVLSLSAICGMSTIILLQIMPYIRDIVLLANVSRSRYTLQIRTEYFIDQEKYFYLIIFHANAAFIIGITAILATGALIIVSFQYACGMFKIASYRMEQAMKINVLKTSNARSEDLIYKEIIYAVHTHRNAMKLIDLMISNFNLSYLLLIVNVTISISLNLFQVFQEISFGLDVKKLVQSCICLIICYLYMCLANQHAQQITDCNNNEYDTVYNAQWYTAPLYIQKTMLFVLQRGAKPFNVNIGGLFIGSLENAATMTSASITYFTVLYSMR